MGQASRVLAVPEPVVQGLEGDAVPLELPLGPFMAVEANTQPKAGREWEERALIYD